MTARRDRDSFVVAFLEDGPTELPDRSYDAVRAQIEHTSQRVVFGPWRLPTMSSFARYGIAAAAIVVVALVGLNLLPKQAPPAVPGASPTTAPPTAPLGPSPSASPTAAPPASPPPAPTPSPLAATLVTNGPLAAGIYYTDEKTATNVTRITFTVPSGWVGGSPQIFPDGGHQPLVIKGGDGSGAVWFWTWMVDSIYADVCQWRDTNVEVGPTADDLLAALAAQTGPEASTPTNVTLGGFPAKRIEIVMPDQEAAFCDGAQFFHWPGVGPNAELTGLWSDSTQTDVVYAADVAGKRLVLVASHLPGTSERDLAELDAIIASINIQP